MGITRMKVSEGYASVAFIVHTHKDNFHVRRKKEHEAALNGTTEDLFFRLLLLIDRLIYRRMRLLMINIGWKQTILYGCNIVCSTVLSASLKRFQVR